MRKHPATTPKPHQAQLVCSGYVPNKDGNHCKINEMSHLILQGPYQGQCVSDFGSTQLQLFYINKHGKIEDKTFNSKSTGIDHNIYTAYTAFASASEADEVARLSDLLKLLIFNHYPAIKLAQLGSQFTDKTERLAEPFNIAGIESRAECSHFTGLERVLTMYELAHPVIKQQIETIIKSASPLKVSAGTVGAAIMGREKYSIEETLTKLQNPTWNDDSHKTLADQENPKFLFVAQAIEHVYPSEREIITKLIQLGQLDESCLDQPVIAYGNTGGGSNPGLWVFFKNGNFSAFELDTNQFKHLRDVVFNPELPITEQLPAAITAVEAIVCSDSCFTHKKDHGVLRNFQALYTKLTQPHQSLSTIKASFATLQQKIASLSNYCSTLERANEDLLHTSHGFIAIIAELNAENKRLSTQLEHTQRSSTAVRSIRIFTQPNAAHLLTTHAYQRKENRKPLENIAKP